MHFEHAEREFRDLHDSPLEHYRNRRLEYLHNDFPSYFRAEWCEPGDGHESG